jgi:hypothetical protein
MIRRVALAGVAAAAILPAMVLVASPAGADTTVGCQSANCSVSLSQFIQLKGSYTDGAGSASYPINVPPPPCLWEPMGDTLSGANQIIGQYGNMTKANDFLGIYESVQLAKKQVKQGGPQGTWYWLPINPAAGAAGAAECLKIPLYAWEAPGQVPPMPPVPPKTLAAYAYNHMLIPSPDVTLSPANRGYVNLASYLWLNWVNHPNGTYHVTATLGNQWATVRAQAASVQVDSPPDGTGYSSCGPDGSKYPVGQAPSNAGPGQPPDCGVLWTKPATSATVTATVRFHVTWTSSGGQGGALNDITITSNPANVSVAEIQNLNG